MKIIDKTPLLDEKGNLGFVQRVQGMLQFGFSWPNELQAQNAIVKFLERQLEKGYTLIPTRLFINERGLAKLEIALARGKKLHDKRDSIKERDAKRELDRLKIR